ncbi:MAG: hypothetical protein B7Y36_16170 [Novosphingobium sp. 28-62-57]|jgi:hypothetical protein|nr:MAG: hypothetical protein B7Y36_16170 [Novosphingobium sp. 28-62-57]OZA40551.1 MAG: hypothetical protein B7X92_01010 [Novosphingobium sp. 17-62-9]
MHPITQSSLYRQRASIGRSVPHFFGFTDTTYISQFEESSIRGIAARQIIAGRFSTEERS